MWPKMLFELLPHFARLMPMADKYLTTRSASEKVQEAALASLTVEMRGELGRAAGAQAGLLRQMQEQSGHIDNLALDVTRMRMGVEGMEAKLGKLEGTVAAADARTTVVIRMLGATLALLLVAVVLAILLVVRSAH